VETVTIVLIIGFSVDYVVHLGNAYWEARHIKKDRLGRVRMALMTMGVTVTMGATTTMFAGFPLIFTEMVFYQKIGTLMVSTVIFSWFWAMFLFIPLLMLFGPQDNVKSVTHENGTHALSKPEEALMNEMVCTRSFRL